MLEVFERLRLSNRQMLIVELSLGKVEHGNFAARKLLSMSKSERKV